MRLNGGSGTKSAICMWCLISPLLARNRLMSRFSPATAPGALEMGGRFGHKPRCGGAWCAFRAGAGARMIRILLAEDDTSMRVYLSRALERSGYQVVAVDRGTAA